MFVTNWSTPRGGIQGYLDRFLDSGDPTFQHIATWTLLQLLESGDAKLVARIKDSETILAMVQQISERTVENEDEEGEDGEAEVVALARRCLEISQGSAGKQTLTEG